MCDYSMHAIASRPAKVGETLVSTDFRGTSTRGFASAEETRVAVCLLPGTELVFEQNVTYRGRWFGSKKVPFSVAQFCKLNPENPHQHHDALAFNDYAPRQLSREGPARSRPTTPSSCNRHRSRFFYPNDIHTCAMR